MDGYIPATRMAQGFDKSKNVIEEECAEGIRLWQELQVIQVQRNGKGKKWL